MVDLNVKKSTFKEQSPWRWDGYLGGEHFESHEDGFQSTDDLIESSGHPFHLGVRGDVGGRFYVQKRRYEGSEAIPYQFYAGAGTTYVGPQFAKSLGVGVGSSHWLNANWHAKSNTDLLAEGSTAISSLIPTAPRINLAVTLGEALTSGLPGLGAIKDMQRRAYTAKNAGKAYLEADFGWAPLVRDVQTLLHVMQNQQTLVQNYIDQAGERIKRSKEWEIESEAEIKDQYSGVSPGPGYNITHGHFEGPSQMTVTHFRYRRQWLEACFTYSIPPDISALSRAMRTEQIANYLYGTRITPEVLWNLAPWSWAVDWFTNLGGFFKNLTELNSNDLVLEYAYIMEHCHVIQKYELEFTYKSGCHAQCTHPSGASSKYQMFHSERKKRLPVGPYNVGWTYDGLTPSQIRTAIALGFSRR